MLQMSAEMCRKPRRESISFSLGDDPTGNHGKSKMIKMINMITRSRDNTHVRRKCRRRFFHVSCLPRRRWRVRRLGRQFVPYGRRGRFKFSFGHLLISFGHLLDILYAHLMSSYVVLHHLTSSYVFLLQTMVLLTWCVLCRPSICRRSISLISHLFGFNLPSWGLPRWCGCKWVKTSKKWWINHKILRILEVPYRPHLHLGDLSQRLKRFWSCSHSASVSPWPPWPPWPCGLKADQ